MNVEQLVKRQLAGETEVFGKKHPSASFSITNPT
jgi:hypothetical protein